MGLFTLTAQTNIKLCTRLRMTIALAIIAIIYTAIIYYTLNCNYETEKLACNVNKPITVTNIVNYSRLLMHGMGLFTLTVQTNIKLCTRL